MSILNTYVILEKKIQELFFFGILPKGYITKTRNYQEKIELNQKSLCIINFKVVFVFISSNSFRLVIKTLKLKEYEFIGIVSRG